MQNIWGDMKLSFYTKDEPQTPYLVEKEGNIDEVNDFHKEQFNTIKQQVSIINHQSNTINLQTDSINENTHTISFQTDIINQQTSAINQHNNIINQHTFHLNIITENMTDALLIINADGSYSYLNKHAYELTFQSKNFLNHDDSLEDTNYYDEDSKILTKEDLPSSRILRGETIKNVILKTIRPDKTTYLSFNGNPIYSNGELVYAILCIRDITEKYNYEQEIKQQKELLEASIENMSDAFAVYDKYGNLLLLNAEARKMYTDLEKQKIIGDAHKPLQYFDLENNLILPENLPTKRAMRGEKVRNEKILIKGPNKVQITEINSTPIWDNENNLVSIITTHRDITQFIINQQELKENQEQLIKSEKEKNEILEASMKLKDEFLYLITHEFRTPMAVVNSALQAIELMYKGEITEKVGKYLATIKQNTNRQLRLVNNLLDITIINSGYIKLNKSYFEIVYLTKAIINSVELYVNQKKVNLYFTSNITKKTVFLDEEKFERIMLNLMSNALKFTPQGKSINVMLSVKKHKNKSFICVSVKDEGIGIPKDRHQIIFERFGQADTSLSRKAEGTGLGLHLVKLLVNAHEGEITLESEEGKGSTFTVALPIVKPIAVEEIAVTSEMNNQFMDSDSRIIQSASIEFSDIYFD